MQNKPIIVFDLDGTLADTLPDLALSINYATATRGLDPVSVQEIKKLAAYGLKPMIRQAYSIHDMPIDEQLVNELFDIAVAEYSKNIVKKTKLYPGAEKSLERFIENGWILAVCTNKPLTLATKLLAELGHLDKFASVCGADSFPYRKPDGRHLTQTIKKAGGCKTSAIMVGDANVDILTAKDADIPVVAVDFGYADIPVTDFECDAIISHYDDLFETAIQLVQNSK